MNTFNRTLKHVVLAVTSISASACLNASILGIPLGPQTGTGGLRVLGAKVFDPVANCAPQLGPPYLASPGRLQLGTNQPNTYVAALELQNTLQDNTRTSQAPPYGQFGSVASTDIQLVGATIRYEFPTLSPVFRFSKQQRPSDGVILTNANASYGASVPAGTTALVGVKLVDSTFGDALAADEEFSTAFAERGIVPMIARVTLEGRSGTGTRIASNEFTYEIDIQDLSTVNCNPTTQGECPAKVCFPNQDFAQVQCVTGTTMGGVLVVNCP